MSTKYTTIIFAVVVIGALAFFAFRGGYKLPAVPVTPTPIATISYKCNEGKTINASFYEGKTTPAPSPDQPPVPGGSVKLALSDGRTMTLAQTISADGTRYSNGNPSVAGNETFVFWSKGKGALVLENNEEKSYIGCVDAQSATNDSLKTYHSNSLGISVNYPKTFSLNESHKYEALGPGKTISGVSFTIDPSLAEGTNLSKGSYVSVESIPNTPSCSADLFLDTAMATDKASLITIDGKQYSMLRTSDAAAGNRYDELVYAIPGTNPCVAVRYFVHYGAIGNYPDTVHEFDKDMLVKIFDAIRDSVVVGR